MTVLAVEVERYLTIRRSVGFKLARAEKLLADYLCYLDRVGDKIITVDNALAWACLPAAGTSNWRGHRLSVVRAFARHLHAIDPTHLVPPAGLLPTRSHRAVPYLYSNDDVTALMTAARTLPSPLRAATFETLIGLLAVTGMRIGEALRLDRDDIDLAHAVIHVRQSKFAKARDVPVHRTTIDKLTAYQRRRDELCPHPRDLSWFVSLAGTRLRYDNAHLAWLGLVRQAGLTPRPAGVGLGHMICATRSPRTRCSTGIARVSMSLPGCRCCRPTSVTSTRPPPTGICQPPPSCSPLPLTGSNRWDGRCDRHARPARRGVLHATIDRPTTRQPAHRRVVSGHVPAAVLLRSTAPRQATGEARCR